MLSAKMAEAQAEASLEAALVAEELAILRGKAATAEASVAMVGRGSFVTEPWELKVGHFTESSPNQPHPSFF
jgi:hypothetical protein